MTAAIIRKETTYLDSAEWKNFVEDIFDGKDDGQVTIVAIARKMPRILEYIMNLENVPYEIITDRALPWLSSEYYSKTKMIFCDDALNVGSTLAHHINYAQDLGLKDALVKVFARRKNRSELHSGSPLSKLNLSVLDSYDEKSYWRFETALPLELLSIGKPFAIDFPIFYLKISEEASKKSPEEWLEHFKRTFCSVHNLTTLSQRSAGISSISIIEPFDFSLEPYIDRNAIASDPPPKIRLYISKNSRQMLIVPMCAPGIVCDFLRSKSIFKDKGLDEIFQALANKPHKGATFPYEPLYSLFLYLISFDYGRLFLQCSPDLFTNGKNSKPLLNKTDIIFLFGKEVATILQELLQNRIGLITPGIKITDTSKKYEIPTNPIKKELCDFILQNLVDSDYISAKPNQIFRQIMKIIAERVGADKVKDDQFPKYDRLRDGLPLHDLWYLTFQVSNRNSDITLEMMSFLLDYYVDCGAAVPVIEKISNVYLRTYRNGEADPVEFCEFIHGLLKRHEDLFPGRALRRRHFAKIIAALSIYHPGKLPIEPMFEFKGIVPYIVGRDKIEYETENAINFLHRKKIVTYLDVEEKEVIKDNDKQLHLF